MTSEHYSHRLLLDSRVVERAENARLVVGTAHKHAANPLFGEDRPWEKRFDNLYGNVILDDEGLVAVATLCWTVVRRHHHLEEFCERLDGVSSA